MAERCVARTFGAAMVLGGVLAGTPAHAQVNVVTYHNDALRTGWNRSETLLTPAAVSGGSFGLLQQVDLDAQVSAQPLLVTGLTVNGSSHDVVYVATEGNSVYAIDASSGEVLLHTTLGTPVSIDNLPGKCPFGGNEIGIESTPVINTSLQTLYVMSYVYTGSTEEYVLHALGLTTLSDQETPAVVSVSHTLSDGATVYDFTPGSNLQRPALLETSGNVYAAFGSFCDLNANSSRGWLIGWHESTLAPLRQSTLTNQVLPANSPHDFFLTSIWMSGYGPAAGGAAGNLFFVTGNTDRSGTTYDNQSGINLSESVVEVTPKLSDVVDYFSPTDSGDDVAYLDEHDKDFGAGGVMLLPAQRGNVPNLAVAAGKVGILYLMNSENLGGENSANVLGEYNIGECFCGPSFFTGSDGIGRVITSGARSIKSWKVATSPTTSLVPDADFNAPALDTGQAPGFFTSISSNGTTADSAVIWAISRPKKGTTDVTLYAFDAATGAQLYSDTAGTWPYYSAGANLVPTVANGKVYVATYKSLSIFGLSNSGHPLIPRSGFVRPAPPPDRSDSAHQISGFVRSVSGEKMVIELRDGRRVTADVSDARRRHAAVRAAPGEAVFLRGNYQRGILRAESLVSARPDSGSWRPDR